MPDRPGPNGRVEAYDLDHTFGSPPEVVWALLADHERYRQWSRIPISRLVEEGHPHRDGVGALRFLGGPGVGSWERIVEFDPPVRMAYTIERGLPISGYRAEVTLEPTADGGTRLRWHGYFEAAPAGLRRVMVVLTRTAVASFVRALARRLP